MLHDKASVIKGIKQAEKLKLREQDAYCAVINSTPETAGSSELDLKLDKIGGFLGIEEYMAGYQCPPSGRDWEDRYQLSWEQIPKRLRLNTIADEDIRRAVYFYSEVAEHTERIKAAAHFCELFGELDLVLNVLFRVWARQSREAIMDAEIETPLMRQLLPQLRPPPPPTGEDLIACIERIESTNRQAGVNRPKVADRVH